MEVKEIRKPDTAPDSMKVYVIEQEGEISRYTASRIAQLVEAYYRIPGNMERFERWKAEQERKQ